MNSFQLKKSTLGDLPKYVTKDDITVILSGISGPSVELKNLMAQSISALSRTNHYLSIQTGFFEAQGKPWVAPVFNSPGQSALERRWVFHEWAKNLQSSFSTRQLVIFLDQNCQVDDLVRAEDLISMFSNPVYTASKWSKISVLAANPEQLEKLSPHYSIRFGRQLQFRRWVNENPDELTSIELGDRLREFATENQCTFHSLAESELQDEKMNLLLAVGQGAKKSPSRLHIVSKNLKPGVPPLALIGKGITFDSGGVNLKPHESFVNCMKNDMGGAALMSQLFMALLETGYSSPIVLAIPACENAIDAASMKPGVIVQSRKGQSVLIEHTDAEGRLILADAMSFICDKYNPKHMYTAATLTTASLRQFSNFYTPVHFASENFKTELSNRAELYGEAFTFWDSFLPFLSGNKTNAADLTNMGRLPSHSSMGGGSNVAAHFLKEFAGCPYTHIDIFNSIWNWSGDYPGAHYGCTGAVFNSLFSTLLS